MPTTTCSACGRRRRHYARGQCMDCYRRAYQRGRWGAMEGKARATALADLRSRVRASRARKGVSGARAT
jgi:predicted Fe-S protein YdhL (DUF1289 family)